MFACRHRTAGILDVEKRFHSSNDECASAANDHYREDGVEEFQVRAGELAGKAIFVTQKPHPGDSHEGEADKREHDSAQSAAGDLARSGGRGKQRSPSSTL